MTTTRNNDEHRQNPSWAQAFKELKALGIATGVRKELVNKFYDNAQQTWPAGELVDHIQLLSIVAIDHLKAAHSSGERVNPEKRDQLLKRVTKLGDMFSTYYPLFAEVKIDNKPRPSMRDEITHLGKKLFPENDVVQAELRQLITKPESAEAMDTLILLGLLLQADQKTLAALQQKTAEQGPDPKLVTVMAKRLTALGELIGSVREIMGLPPQQAVSVRPPRPDHTNG